MAKKFKNYKPFDKRFSKVENIDKVELERLSDKYNFRVEWFGEDCVIHSQGETYQVTIEEDRLLLIHGLDKMPRHSKRSGMTNKSTIHRQRYYYTLDFMVESIIGHNRFKGLAI